MSNAVNDVRTLPYQQNPYLNDEKSHVPRDDELVKTRQLGKTSVNAPAGRLSSTSGRNATRKVDFEYTYLRVRLPRDLRGSGVIVPLRDGSTPTTYFLMCRSSDLHVCATGMFKATYPWASRDDEMREREYLLRFAETDPTELAGNLWVERDFALALARDYHIHPWIRALLDPSPIGPSDSSIHQSPPVVNMARSKQSDVGSPAPPKSTRKHRAESREMRSASPQKHSTATPGRQKATPRRRKNNKKHDGETMKAPSSSLRQSTADPTPSIADSVDEAADEVQNEVATDAIADAAAAAAADEIAEAAEAVANEAGAANVVKGGAARITVEENVEDDMNDGVETTRTNVKVEMPTGTYGGAPNDPEAAIEAAKAIVADVKELKSEENIANGIVAAGKKRKADELETEEPEEEIVEQLVNGDGEAPAEGNESSPPAKRNTTKKQQQGTTSSLPLPSSDKKGGKVEFGARTGEPPAKRARVMVPAEDFRRQKMQKRALVGLSATLAVGLVLISFQKELLETEFCNDLFPMSGCIEPLLGPKIAEKIGMGGRM